MRVGFKKVCNENYKSYGKAVSSAIIQRGLWDLTSIGKQYKNKKRREQQKLFYFIPSIFELQVTVQVIMTKYDLLLVQLPHKQHSFDTTL